MDKLKRLEKTIEQVTRVVRKLIALALELATLIAIVKLLIIKQ